MIPHSVKCPIGRYEKDGICTDCPANTFSNTVGSTKCTDCQSSLKTVTTGSDSESDCTSTKFFYFLRLELSFRSKSELRNVNVIIEEMSSNAGAKIHDFNFETYIKIQNVSSYSWQQIFPNRLIRIEYDFRFVQSTEVFLWIQLSSSWVYDK